MSSSKWSGNSPGDRVNAQSRLCLAALECIKRQGFERTTMSDIAKQAGIARPTLYKYFKSKHEILLAGIDMVALEFAQAVVKHARTYTSLEDRIIETILYVVKAFPKHPYLSLTLDNECAPFLRERAFSDEATMVFSEMTAEPLIELDPSLANEGTEITEIMSRFALSLILFPGNFNTEPGSLRKIIKRRLLPGLIKKTCSDTGNQTDKLTKKKK